MSSRLTNSSSPIRRTSTSSIDITSTSTSKTLIALPTTSNHSIMHNTHRILKERNNESTKSTIPLLPPFSSSSSIASSSSSSIASFTVNNNSSLTISPNNNNNNNSSSSSSSIECMMLKRRVSDLEGDVDRLRRHVNQAEEAISNYRGFLSPTTTTTAVYHTRRMDTSMQTDATYVLDSNPMNMVDSISQSKIAMLEGLLKNSQQQYNEMKQENSKLKEKDLKNNETMNTMQTEASVLRAQVSSIRVELLELQKRLNKANDDNNNTMKKDHNEKLALFSKEIDKLKLSITKLRDQTKQELEAFYDQIKHYMTMIIRKENDTIGDLEMKLREAGDKIACHDSKVSEMLDEISSLNEMLHEKEEEVDLLKSAAEVKRVLSESCDQACDPLSPLFNRQSRTSELELAQEQTKDEMARALDSLDDEKKKSEDLALKMKAVAEKMLTLQENYGSQIDAARHIAHVKDLVRVSSIREISLERDRIIGELKHYKELCNILSFSLNTSEQALKETQPHVVDKLIEGRTKRILALEKINKERKKDIDQRSAETCAVSSTHLESFSVKAQTKYDAAEEVTKDSLKLMSDIFQTASIEMPIYIFKKK